MIRRHDDPSNPNRPGRPQAVPHKGRTVNLPAGVSPEQMLRWLSSQQGEAWFNSARMGDWSSNNGQVTYQNLNPPVELLQKFAETDDPLDYPADMAIRAPDAPDSGPMVADASPAFYAAYKAAWARLRRQYPMWGQNQLREAATKMALDAQRGQQQAFDEMMRPPEPPPRQPQETDPIRKLIEDARKQMDMQDRLRDAQQQIQLEALKREAMRTGQQVMWENGKPYVGTPTPAAPAPPAAMPPAQRPPDWQPPPPGFTPSPHPDFTPGSGNQFQVITHWHNPGTGETVAMPNPGFKPKPGTPWRPGRAPEATPGKAQPIAPPSQGTPYGEPDPRADSGVWDAYERHRPRQGIDLPGRMPQPMSPSKERAWMEERYRVMKESYAKGNTAVKPDLDSLGRVLGKEHVPNPVAQMPRIL